jgi:hypothetical protein
MGKLRILNSEYAAFRDDIQKYFREKVLKKPSIIFDPMAGTAPLIPFIETKGHTAYLNDILPLHFFINKAKTYDVFRQYQRQHYDWFVQKITRCMAPLNGKILCMSDKWIDDIMLRGLVQAWHATEDYSEDSATLMKAVILLCVRPLSSTTRSNNPTWLKFGGISTDKPLEEIIHESLIRFDKYYFSTYGSSFRLEKRGRCIITKDDAIDLHIPQKADFILTSPPYCNRLDPIVQYGPENYFLSALGYASRENDLISIPKVRNYDRVKEDFEFLTTNSKHASHLLTEISESSIPDDPSYYLKYYVRYFAILYSVISKVLTNLSSAGKMYIVTQDNIHRGLLIEIDAVLRELLSINGWRSRVVKKWERPHLGLRHVSREHAFVKPRHWEKLMVVTR